MAKIDSAYAYYASTYANKEVSRYDSHKKSDLRKIYNRIIKTNKESPLYKISNEMGMEFATASLHNSFYFVEAKNIIHVRGQEICYRYKGKL